MVERILPQTWTYRLIYLGLALVILFAQILPVDLSAGRWPGPDLFMVISYVWVLRRPDYVPVALVAFVILAGDLLFMRPPGLWAGLMVIGLEFLRSREHLSRDLPFVVEWTMVSGVMIAITMAYRVILTIFVVDQPGFGLVMIGLLASIISYPVAVLASRVLFGVRKIAPGEVDQLGHHI